MVADRLVLNRWGVGVQDKSTAEDMKVSYTILPQSFQYSEPQDFSVGNGSVREREYCFVAFCGPFEYENMALSSGFETVEKTEAAMHEQCKVFYEHSEKQYIHSDTHTQTHTDTLTH
jgi:hypothetical protein